jgi:hypothetical protein
VSIVTNADALAEIQHLKATSTGRLRGRPASATRYDPVDRFLRDTPEPWRSRARLDHSPDRRRHPDRLPRFGQDQPLLVRR